MKRTLFSSLSALLAVAMVASSFHDLLLMAQYGGTHVMTLLNMCAGGLAAYAVLELAEDFIPPRKDCGHDFDPNCAECNRRALFGYDVR